MTFRTWRFFFVGISSLVILSLGPTCALALPMPKLKVDTTSISRKTGGVTSYAPVVSNVAPSVVSVYTRKRAPGVPLFNDPLFRRFFGGGENVPRNEQALGSGVIVSEDGYILTNNHVVEGAEEIRVSTADETEYPAKLIGTDPPTDTAVIKIEAKNLPVATLTDSANIRVGDVVLAIGNPFAVGQTVTCGIISATERAGLGITEYEDFIQTDASINPGNSGGPLVDVEGRVIGLNTAIFTRSAGGGSMGIGFAVPINQASNALSQIVETGRVVRGFLGVSVQSLNLELAKSFKVPNAKGALVASVGPKSPAARAGLEEGDVIIKVGGQAVDSARALRLLIAQTKPNTDVQVTVLRNGEQKTFTATLGELPRQTAKAGPGGREGFSAPLFEGVELQELDGNTRQELKLPDEITGVVVASVEEGSAAYREGLREGDIITGVDRKKVNSVDDVRLALRKAGGKPVLLRVWSEGNVHFLVLGKAEAEKGD